MAKSKELLKRTEEIFGKGWEPEVETLDTFIDSSWYFLRYLDPKNEKQISSKEKQEKWMPVDLYFGGSEHTTLHLLYSRFFQKVLFDLDVVTEKEPYKKRLNRGLIMGPDGQKMSKSRGNVVDPDEMVDKVGSDTVKMYLAFIGPYAETGSYPWDMGGIAGIRRFLERVYALREGISEDETVDSEVEKNIHKLIKKSTEDIEQFKFNTAISAMMSFLNALKGKNITKSQYEILIRLMAPFAPFLSEEIWENSGHKTSIHLESWPKFDSKKASEEEFTVVVQVNGKVRGSFKSSKSLEEDEAKAEAIALEGIKKWVQGKEIKKIIYVKDRVINILLG